VTTVQEPVSDKIFVRRAVEAAIRIGLVALLVIWCFQIVQPFIVPLVWGIIIAVAVHPGYRPIEAALANRRMIAATLFTLVMLILLIGPTVMLAGTVVGSAQNLAADLTDGTLSIPAPPEDVGSWPIIGERVERIWRLASVNLTAALGEIRPQIAAFARWLLATVADLGLGILQFVIAIIIAGVLLAHAKGGGETARTIATRLAGDRGVDYAELGQATVRSVARGILGVALIQSLLAGLGFLAVGVPAAGLLALVCLLLAVVQIGPAIVLIGTAIYVFSTADTFTAVIYLIWSIFVALIDNVLKPLLLGRGVRVPMIVIFVGAIGGFLASGIIGLFVGSVVLALSFTLFKAWLAEPLQSGEEQSFSNPSRVR
jgi:predicted PurR-regulated permease PerM